MPEKIDSYVKAFATLRTDSNRHRWTAATNHRAPHKPFLLLAILDLIAQGVITREFVEPSFELAETFAGYWSRVMPLGTSGIMAYPFYHMDSEPFWQLAPLPGVMPPAGRVVSSMKRIRELYLGAQLDAELFPLLLMAPLRERLRATLIQTYFHADLQPLLVEQGQVNLLAYRYEQMLITGEKTAEAGPGAADNPILKRVRDQGFRKAIVELYQHRCAMCGIRMLTPDGHTAVDAAHIIPWHRSNNDHPTNGLALCRMCHWSFDEGLMGVGKKYEVLVSSQVKKEHNLPGHMLALTDRPMFRPEEARFWPDQGSCGWHRKEVFRR
jgi:putative restriction endonuclease